MLFKKIFQREESEKGPSVPDFVDISNKILARVFELYDEGNINDETLFRLCYRVKGAEVDIVPASDETVLSDHLPAPNPEAVNLREAPERLVLTPSGTVRPLTVTIQPVREEAVPADDDSQTRGVAISSAAAQEHPARRARNVLAIDRNSVPKTGGAPGSEFFSSVAELAGQGVRGINVSTTTHVPITSTNEPVPVRCALQPKKITITKPTAITKPAVVSVSTLEKTVEEQPIPPKPEKKLIKPELRFQ